MPEFIKVNNRQEIASYKGFTEVPRSKQVGRLVDETGTLTKSSYEGRTYLVASEKEHTFSYLERAGRGLLGTLITVSSLGLALLSDSIQNLFTQEKRVIRFGFLCSNSQDDSSAIKIQKHVKRHLAGKDFLPRELFPKYRSLVGKPLAMPRASGGNTPVFLPDKLPEVILKSSGRKAAVARFQQMREVKEVLKAQNSSHLTVPKARLCEKFLIEERVPINVDTYHNMSLYLSEPAMFDNAVRELTRLFSKTHLTDLVSRQRHPISHIEGVEDTVRYDNLPLYIAEKNGTKTGKIGLIDLEHIEKGPGGLDTLARIFPYHLNIILEEAKKCSMSINNSELQAAAEKGKKFLKIGFSDHSEWLKKKNISSLSPLKISPEKRVALTEMIEQKLLQLNKTGLDLSISQPYKHSKTGSFLLDFYHYFNKPPSDYRPNKDFLADNSTEQVKALASIFGPLLIDGLEKAIMEENESEEIIESPISQATLVGFRSPSLRRKELYDNLILKNDTVKTSIQKHFKKNVDTWDIGFLADHLFNCIMQELVKSEDIFSFDPGYSANPGGCWIRY